MTDVGRTRATYLALTLVTVVVGLLVHRGALPLHGAARDVVGDALWAAMIHWATGVLAPRARVPVRSGAAVAFCAAVELSQLVHGPTLDAVRATTLGHLVLGSDWDPRDLAAYAGGVLAAALADAGLVRRPRHTT